MLRTILKYANGLYNTYRFDIFCDIDRFEFYKAKFFLDQANAQRICNLLYQPK